MTSGMPLKKSPSVLTVLKCNTEDIHYMGKTVRDVRESGFNKLRYQLRALEFFLSPIRIKKGVKKEPETIFRGNSN